MTRYDLYLESGPRHRKTMVHVLDLLGCVAVGPTTEAAVAAAPAAIEAYRRFLVRAGERVSLTAPIATRVAEHITEGVWLGNGSPYAVFAPDLEPLSARDVERFAHRVERLGEELAAWAETRTDADLDAAPAEGRTERAILQHVLASGGAYVSPMLGGAKGFAAVQRAAERGELPLSDALRRMASLAADALRDSTPDERVRVVERPMERRTLRKATRRMLEHSWEHLAELARRPGGPAL